MRVRSILGESSVETNLIVLTIATTLYAFWLVVCIVLKATVRIRDPKSWHYRLMDNVYRPVPRESCAYFGRLAIIPPAMIVMIFLMLAMLILMGALALLRAIVDWIILPVLMGQLRTGVYERTGIGNRWNAHGVSNPFTLQYWKDACHERNDYGTYDFLPIPPILVLFVLIAVGGYLFFGWSVVAGKATIFGEGMGYWWAFMIESALAVLVITWFSVKKVSKTDLWNALANKICFELKDPSVDQSQTSD